MHDRNFTHRMLEKLQVGLKITFILICTVILFGGHYPPASAQRSLVPEITVKDAQQDDHITETDKHLEATDGRVAKQGDEQTKNALDISELQTEARFAAGILISLVSGSIVIQLKFKKTSDH